MPSVPLQGLSVIIHLIAQSDGEWTEVTRGRLMVMMAERIAEQSGRIR
jgi:hypothetical protein